MTIHAKYDRYLSHLGATVPVSALHTQPQTSALCALRHDVDHDLDVALEMAHLEHRRGVRATYYVLPKTPYWADPRLIDKCLQLQDYGHEVGLHVNCMAEWVSGETDDPQASLHAQLTRLRDGGVDVVGISAHGDRRCYQHNVSNYWCFRELRPLDPLSSENGRTAEGPYAADGWPRLLYPASGEVQRPDGARLALWSIAMAPMGLHYHAWHTRYNRYFSDSGGGWTRTPDPLELRRRDERWQVLIHPIHWLGPKRLYFFLSTARSGSRWLAEVLDQATPLTARHEYVLNQDYHRGETAQKASANVRALQDNPHELQARLAEAWEEFDGQDRDHAEVNVYLESFLEELRRFFPDAVLVHLHRNPAQVVRSLMDRDWYDTPEDHAHPRLKSAEAHTLDRFERVCQYVAEANERLLDACDQRIALDDLTSSPDSLARALEGVGVVYHPRLGREVAGQVINRTKAPGFPAPDQWSAAHQRRFNLRCAKTARALGYAHGTAGPIELLQHALDRVRRLAAPWRLALQDKLIFSRRGEPLKAREVGASNCRLSIDEDTDQLTIRPLKNERHAYATLGGSDWRALKRIKKQVNAQSDAKTTVAVPPSQCSQEEDFSGWPVPPGGYVKGRVEMEIRGGGSVALFAMSYNCDGKQVYRRQVGVLDSRTPKLAFAFAPRPDAAFFDVAFYMSAARLPTEVIVNSWSLETHRNPV